MHSRSERAQGVRPAIKRAGEILAMGFMRGGAHTRDQVVRGQHVSDLDFTVEQVLLDAIRGLDPECTFQGDCFFAGGTGNRWVVRAIDGRDNFYRQRPHFCISVACTSANQVTSAWVYDPLHQRLYELDDGCVSLNGLPIKPSTHDTLQGALIDVACVRPGASDQDWYRLRSATNHGVEFRQFGCANLSLCDVATGQVDGFFDAALKVPDFIAGQAIAQAAGAIAGNSHLAQPWANPMQCLVVQRHVLDALLAIWPDLEQAIPL